MKKCVTCGSSDLERGTDDLEFNSVALVSGTVYTCRACGERYEAFARVELLSKTVARHIARRPERLTPAEIRFVRTYLGYSSKDFATFLGVAPETISRWESTLSPKPMPLSTEKLLRFMALNDKPITDYGLDGAGSSDAESFRPHFRHQKGRWTAA